MTKGFFEESFALMETSFIHLLSSKQQDYKDDSIINLLIMLNPHNLFHLAFLQETQLHSKIIKKIINSLVHIISYSYLYSLQMNTIQLITTLYYKVQYQRIFKSL